MRTLSWIKKLTRTKFVIEHYEKRIDKYYGLCGCSYQHEKLEYCYSTGLASSIQRLTCSIDSEELIERGFILVRTETVYR